MTIEIVTVPCLADNYAFLVHEDGRTALVDAPEAAPIRAALDARGWALDEIWITHKDSDHIDGVPELRAVFGAKVTGAADDAHRLPPLDRAVRDGERFAFGDHPVAVMDVSGHTVGHIAFYLAAAHAVFTGDSLMALGCGRVREAPMERMWQSLSALAALPGETMVYSGHEYAADNGRFALTIEPANPDLISRTRAIAAARARGKATVPSRLSEELATNPFLRAKEPGVKALLGMQDATDAEVFAEIRTRKNRF